jgi:hypothetical protein
MKHNLLISREGYGSDIMVEIPEYLAKEITSDFSRFRISGVCVELENVENVVNRIPYAAIKECINLWNNGTGKIDAIKYLRAVAKDMGYYISLKTAKDTLEEVTK